MARYLYVDHSFGYIFAIDYHTNSEKLVCNYTNGLVYWVANEWRQFSNVPSKEELLKRTNFKILGEFDTLENPVEVLYG